MVETLFVINGCLFAILAHFTLKSEDHPPGVIIALGWLMFHFVGVEYGQLAEKVAGYKPDQIAYYLLPRIGGAVPIIVIGLMAPMRARHWSGPKLKTFLKCLMLALVINQFGVDALSSIYYLLHTYCSLPRVGSETSFLIHLSILALFFRLSVVTPVVEEILYRGYLFDAFKRHCPVWLAMIFTSFIFASAHLSLYFFPFHFVHGMIFAYVRHRTGSLYASVFLHSLHNTLGVIVEEVS